MVFLYLVNLCRYLGPQWNRRHLSFSFSPFNSGHIKLRPHPLDGVGHHFVVVVTGYAIQVVNVDIGQERLHPASL